MYQRFTNKKVLIIPLNWGLGHATRCVPIIESLIKVNAQITISGSGESGCYLKQRFDSLTFIEDCPDYGIHYGQKGVSLFSMLLQWPKLERAIVNENRWLGQYIQEHSIDFILSDHRFGIHHSSAYNIFISHQLNPILPFFMREIFQYSQKRKLKFFQEIWIPDQSAPSDLSGDLSKYLGEQVIQRIGWLSRFNYTAAIPFEPYEWVGWVSGPETQRSVFEEFLQVKFERSGKRCLLICGQPHLSFDTTQNGVRRISHLSDGEMKFVIANAERCFARSGYSTLMDLKALKVNAELFPTPGQSEQIYLAKRWKSFC